MKGIAHGVATSRIFWTRVLKTANNKRDQEKQVKGEAVAPGEAGWPRRWEVFNTTCGGVNQKNEVEQT